jgi:hypothetical protein
MNILVTVVAISIITFIGLYFGTKNAHEEENDAPLPKFQPRKMTDLSNTEQPKRRYKRRNKKKKPVVEQNLTTEKKSVGRPRKSE